MKTRLIASVLAAASVLCCFSACGDSDDDSSPKNSSSNIESADNDAPELSEPDAEASNLYKAVSSALMDLEEKGEKGECLEPDYNFSGWVDLDHMCYLDDYSREQAEEQAMLETLTPEERLKWTMQPHSAKEFPNDETNDELLRGERMMSYIKSYDSHLSYLESAVVYIKQNTCVAAAVCVDGEWGAYPKGFIDDIDRSGLTKEECMTALDAALAERFQ